MKGRPAPGGYCNTIAVNGQSIASSPEPGKFAKVDRTWKKGDRIEIEFDMPTTLVNRMVSKAAKRRLRSFKPRGNPS